ncbi:hypothetical protein MCOR25_003418 [Pyricularia grisea]|nr:hypothetical protein MCOR25_003418 [Pyricularia grisea]
MADKMSIDRKDPVKEDTPDTVGSSLEGEQQTQQGNNATNNGNHQEPQEAQQPKRKGGRKPIYATSEERKQRNRQAQAAFRERRTEYIKQLEEAIKIHEQNLHQLQAAHRNAADECLMLRYKNSLLERILLEKGIDVQAELRAKTGSPNLGPTHMPQNLVPPPPISRSLLNRHHSRRSNSSIAPKMEPGLGALHPSPASRQGASSHSASPTNTTSIFAGSPAGSASDHHQSGNRSGMPPGGMKPQQAVTMSQGLPPSGPPRGMQQQMHTAAHRAHAMRVAAATAGGATPSAPFYPSPAFQSHIDQLEQEYDAADNMMDDCETPDTPSGPGPYPGAPYSGEGQSLNLSSPAATGTPLDSSIAPSPAVTTAAAHTTSAYPSMTQLLDTGIDWDPFGLTASMAFPNGSQFAFDTSNMR